MTATANFHLILSLVAHQPFPVPIPKDIGQTAIRTTPILSTYDLNCNTVSPMNKAVYFQSKMFMNGATALHTFFTLDFLPVKSHNKQTYTQKKFFFFQNFLRNHPVFTRNLHFKIFQGNSTTGKKRCAFPCESLRYSPFWVDISGRFRANRGDSSSRLEEGPDSFSWFLGNVIVTSEGLETIWICKTLERDTTTKENNLQKHHIVGIGRLCRICVVGDSGLCNIWVYF